MIFRTKRDNEPELNLTPLIDVVFLLLIFFMVSTTFERESEISIELPEATGEEVEQQQFVIEISIDSQGGYFINQKRLKDNKIETLKLGIRKTRGQNKDPKLVINADKDTPHQAVVIAMDAARQLGLVHLTFATKLNNK
ncbi:MAG: biopolymer transporter ExbD [Gammaproteobacteria bacterium]|nr:biopolymer transporter ExbD [Gammaproteobacteria bacterium]